MPIGNTLVKNNHFFKILPSHFLIRVVSNTTEQNDSDLKSKSEKRGIRGYITGQF